MGVHLIHGLPLLPDEEVAIESAAVVILEAAKDEEKAAAGGQMIFDPKQGKLVSTATWSSKRRRSTIATKCGGRHSRRRGMPPAL